MGEGFRGGGEAFSRIEREPQIETKERLDALNRLLARLVETGGDLPSDIKRGLRAQIRGLLHLLGLKSLEDYDGWAELYQRLHEPLLHLPEPENYPTKDECKARLQELYRAPQPEALPPVPTRPRATHMALFAQADWSEITGRGGVGAVDYIFELGKVMSSEFAYRTLFEFNDQIGIGEQWSVENGRPRATTLRVLGVKFVNDQGMDRWVTAMREKKNDRNSDR